METANPQGAIVMQPNRRLAAFIAVGLALAAVIALGFILFHTTPTPPKLAVFPGARVLSAGDNGGEFQVDMQANADLTSVNDFYQKEFINKGWTKQSDVTSTDEHHTSTFESNDLQWGATLDIDYNAADGVTDIGIYERKLGD